MKNLNDNLFHRPGLRNRMKILFSLVFIMAINCRINASLQIVNTDISANTTWSADTILVTASITVNNGATLTIAPGTVVLVDGHYAINIQGVILALGEENDMIQFSVSDTTMFADTDTTKGGWRGLRFNVTHTDTSFIDYCIIEYTKAKGADSFDKCGGAIYAVNSPHISLSNCILRNNYAEFYGAGLYLRSSAVAIVNACIFYNNKVDAYGAGLYTTDNAYMHVNGCLISNNYAPNGGGGGICSDGDGVLINNVITNNSAQYGGGLIFASKDPVLKNNTIAYNTANYGGGVFSTSGSNPVFTNCIIGANVANNSGSQVYIEMAGSSPDFNYCDIQEGSDVDHGFGFGGGVSFEGQYENCLDDDPIFRQSPEGPGYLFNGLSNDYSIAFNSVCRDAGKPDYTADSVGIIDFAGEPRFMYDYIDIGAYEYQYGYFGTINDILHGWCTEDTVRITGDITVEDGTLLIVCAGTVVLFEGNHQLIVEGQIYAPGEEDNPIKFTAADTSAGWGGIRFIDLNNHTDSSYMAYCQFEYGKATGSNPDNRGGALYFHNSNNVFILNSQFLNCSAETYGGAIGIFNNSDVTLYNNIIGINSALDGGGVAIFNSKPLLMNNVIAQNTATSSGAGLWIDNGAAPMISNNTIADNNGTGIYSNNSNYELGNSIIWGNTNNIDIQGDSVPTIIYSDFESAASNFTGFGNITEYPLFIGEDFNMNYYQTHPLSPVINKGNPYFEIMDLVDILGNDRIIDDTIDMGAYEYDGSWYGHISGALNLCDDTIEVSNDIYIDSGAVVTICPGTVVEFQGHYGIDVQGQILAEGTANDRIEFTVSDTTGLSNMEDDEGSWFGFVFDTPEETADTSKFDYCNFRYAKHETSSDITDGSTFYIDNTRKLAISNSIFENNYSIGGGGAVFLDHSSVSFYKNIFRKNISDFEGGAISSISSNSNILLCQFISNTAISGGAICFVNSDSTYLEGNLIYGNSASDGGGITFDAQFYGKIVNNTIVKNTANDGGAFAFFMNCNPQIINTILWDNGNHQIFIEDEASDPYFSYCNIDGDTTNFVVLSGSYDQSRYTNNKNSDPLFSDAANNIFTLRYNSPCVDSGYIVTMKSPVDMNGNERIETNIDMGAFEYHNAMPTAFTFSGSSVDENVPIGTLLGTFEVTDINVEDVYGFEFVAGSGDDNNGWIRLSNDSVYSIRDIDYEATPSLSFRVTAFDVRRPGNNITESFSITVNDEIEDGTNDKSIQSPFVNLFPNPVIDNVTVVTSVNEIIQSIQIIGIDGRILFYSENINSNTQIVNTENLEKGLYIMRIDVDGARVEKIFIK
ncbi:MAG: right-handed parallel beta-helix repeat-containing protein [Bacteroidales bacterium]|nr:right-handed parallel beta-helix repeat-containing protein [Bacteroidales bacterium]